jgi:hypothetical protein
MFLVFIFTNTFRRLQSPLLRTAVTKQASVTTGHLRKGTFSEPDGLVVPVAVYDELRPSVPTEVLAFPDADPFTVILSNCLVRF